MAVTVVASIAKVRTVLETTLKGFQRNEKRKERERKEGKTTQDLELLDQNTSRKPETS